MFGEGQPVGHPHVKPILGYRHAPAMLSTQLISLPTWWSLQSRIHGMLKVEMNQPRCNIPAAQLCNVRAGGRICMDALRSHSSVPRLLTRLHSSSFITVDVMGYQAAESMARRMDSQVY